MDNNNQIDDLLEDESIQHRDRGPVDYTFCVCHTIRLLRRRYSIQSKELAKHLGINNSNYSRLERGQVANVSSSIIMKIIEFYQIDVYTFNRYVAACADKRRVHDKLLGLNDDHPFSCYKPDPNASTNDRLRIFSNISFLLTLNDFRNTNENNKYVIDVKKFLERKLTLFIEIPLFSDYEIINSRIVFSGFIGKTYITHKLYLNNIYHGFNIAGLVKDNTISFISSGSFSNVEYNSAHNELNQDLKDEYSDSLLNDKAFCIDNNPKNPTKTKSFNSYNYGSLLYTSSKIFISYFDELINLLSEKDISPYLINKDTINGRHSFGLRAAQTIADKFYQANNMFANHSLNRNLQDCNDLLESVSFDDQYHRFVKLYLPLLRKYTSI